MPWTKEQAREAGRRRWEVARAAKQAQPVQLGELRPHLTPPAPAPDNVIPIRSGPTLAEALQALRPPAPVPQASPPEETPTPAPAAQNQPPPEDPPERPPSSSSGNRLFSQMAASCCTTVAVVVMTKSIEAEGLIPNEPGDDDIETCQQHTADAIARGLGDREVPWWAAMALSYGQLYAGMRIGASKIARPAPLEAPAVNPDKPAPVPADDERPSFIKPDPFAQPPPRNRGPIPWQPLPPIPANKV